jgi:ABC-type nitrate/sulfonate/bicarbonate transport system substrate-binding protein
MVLALAMTACGDAEPRDQADAGTEEATTEGPARPVTVMIAEATAFRLPIRIAEQEGLFAENGIDIELVPQPANLQAFQGMEASGAQIGQLIVGSLGQAWQAGASGALFCGTLPVVQTSLLAASDSDLPSVADGATWQEVLQSLEGKRVGIQTPVGSALQLLFASALEEVGVSDVTYVNLGPGGPAAQAALANDAVDVAQASPTGTQFLLDQGIAEELIYLPEGPDAYQTTYGSGWVAMTSWLDEEPELAKGFCDAFAAGVEFIQDPANAEASSAMLQQETGVAPDVAELVLDTVYDDYSADLPLDTLQGTLDRYVELGVLKSDPRPDVEQLVRVVSE